MSQPPHPTGDLAPLIHAQKLLASVLSSLYCHSHHLSKVFMNFPGGLQSTSWCPSAFTPVLLHTPTNSSSQENPPTHLPKSICHFYQHHTHNTDHQKGDSRARPPGFEWSPSLPMSISINHPTSLCLSFLNYELEIEYQHWRLVGV